MPSFRLDFATTMGPLNHLEDFPMTDPIQQAVDLYAGAVQLTASGVHVKDPSRLQTAATDKLVWQAVFGSKAEQEAARWVIWELGQAVGARPASITGPGV